MTMASHTPLPSTRAFAVALLSAATATIANAHVLLPFSRHEGTTAHQLSARADSSAISTFSNSFAYMVNASIGTPPQQVSMLISPSIGDTLVPSASASMCRTQFNYRDCDIYKPYKRLDGTTYYPRTYDPTEWGDAPGTPCTEGRVSFPGACKWGSYNQSLSSTYLPANSRYQDFEPVYLDPQTASGTNITDKLVVGDIEMEDYPLGVVTSSTWWIGVLGLGFNSTTASYLSSSSSSYASRWTGSYTNFMDRLVRSGKIKSQAYSIYLDNPEGTSGGLLFGAVDKNRYTGDLVRLTASNSYTFPRTFGAVLQSINGTNSSDAAMSGFKSNEFPLDVTIGVGELFSYLPDMLADAIGKMAGAVYNSSLEYMTIPCDIAKTNKAKFSFELGGTGGPVLQVDIADLVIPATVFPSKVRYGGTVSGKLATENKCLFGIQKRESSSSSSYLSSAYSSYYNLGSSLLRRSYLVFDLANQEVAVAAVKFPSGSERLDPDILTFDSHRATVPSAKVFSKTCGEYEYSCRTIDNDSRSRGSGGSRNATSDSLSHWQTVAIGISVPFGLLFLVAFIAGIVICGRLRREKKAKAVDGETTDAESQVGVDVDGVTRPAVAATRGGERGLRAPQGPLPMIEERPETATSMKQHEPAPQLPALSLTPPPPEMAESSDRNSVAVSALSEDANAAPTTAPAASTTETTGATLAAATTTTTTEEDKGKGKEKVTDHSA